MTQLDRIELLLSQLLTEIQAQRPALLAASTPLRAAAPSAPVRGFPAPQAPADTGSPKRFLEPVCIAAQPAFRPELG